MRGDGYEAWSAARSGASHRPAQRMRVPIAGAQVGGAVLVSEETQRHSILVVGHRVRLPAASRSIHQPHCAARGYRRAGHKVRGRGMERCRIRALVEERLQDCGQEGGGGSPAEEGRPPLSGRNQCG